MDVSLAPFEVLGVSPTATPGEVKAAYLVLAQIYHPDRYQDASDDVKAASEERMRALNEAYQEAQRGNLAVRPMAGKNGSSRRGGSRREQASDFRPPAPGVPWDVAVQARAAAMAKAEADRRAKEQARPQGQALARPRSRDHRPVLKGLGMARFTNNIVCTGCESVQWLPANWRDMLDDYAFYCSMCDRLIFTR
jgi:hypothetical protein